MTQYDLYHDPGHGRLRHLLPQFPAVETFVKQAHFEDSLEQVPTTAFAWPAVKRFPVHTPAHAAISYLYAKTAEEKIPAPVLQEITTALDIYGLGEDLFTPVRAKEAALTDEDCLLPEQQAYPVRNAEEVKLAEARLLPQISKLHPETRAKLFHKLAERAVLHGVKLQPTSYKYAGLSLCDRKGLVEGLRARGAATKLAECKKAYLQLADSVQKERNRPNKEMLVKVAEAIGKLDQHAGLISYYDRGLPDPISTVFNTEKVAFGDEIDLGGCYVRPQALSSVGSKFYSDLLGSDIVRDIAPYGDVDPHLASQILTTLPAEEKRIVGQALRDAGVGHAG